MSLDNQSPLVSVIMLSYNHQDYIERALRGVLEQETSFPFEIIIHDDASTDESAKIIEKYAVEYPDRIISILQEDNRYCKGVAHLMKGIFPYCRGTFFAFCECDDFWIDKHKLQKQVDFLLEHPHHAAVYHNSVIIDDSGKPNEKTAQQKGCYAQRREGDVSLFEFSSTGLYPGQTATAMIRESAIRAKGLEKLIDLGTLYGFGDTGLLLLSFFHGKVRVLPYVMAAHRVVYDKGTSWTAEVHGKNLYGEQFVTTLALKSICKEMGRHYYCSWTLFCYAFLALRAEKELPDATNIAQAAMVRDSFNSTFLMFLRLFGWGAVGLANQFFWKLIRKVRPLRQCPADGTFSLV